MLLVDEPSPITADGLYTHSDQLYLAVRTADCLPIFLGDDSAVFAFHCGWRGLVNGLLLKLKTMKLDKKRAEAIVGPHIGWNEFEVGLEVKNQINEYLNHFQIFIDPLKLFRSHQDPKKCYVNLEYLAVSQLVHIGLLPEKIFSTKVDTFTNKNWHSFRRDQANAGRNIHLVLKK